MLGEGTGPGQAKEKHNPESMSFSLKMTETTRPRFC